MNQSQTAPMTDTAAMLARLDVLITHPADHSCPHCALYREVRALLARLDQAETDARRYRWLRGEVWREGRVFIDMVKMGGDWSNSDTITDAETLDANIDAAIDQQRSGK